MTGSARRRTVGASRTGALIAVSPALLLLALFLGLPLVAGLWLSLSRWGGTGSPVWVGLDNFRSVFSDGSLGHTLLVTTEFAVLSTVGVVGVAALLAAAVSAGVPGASAYRVLIFLPVVAPGAAIGVFWFAAFQPRTGVVNRLLGVVGLGDAHTWLADPDTALYPVVFVTVWTGVGFAFLLILGAMEQVPVSLYEAARVDGASAVRRFFSITLPLIRPVLTVVTLLNLIAAFNAYPVVWAMTNGGPGDATNTLPVAVYREAFQQTDFGRASALAVLGGVILVAVGLIGLRLSRSAQEVTR